MRNADAEIAALAKQGIDLDPQTEQAYRDELDRLNAEPPVAPVATPAPKPQSKRKR